MMGVGAGARPRTRGAFLIRFDKVERLTHWSTAALFTILILTGLALYFPSVGSLVGRRHLVAQIHLWTGVALPVPVLLALVGPWGSRFRQDVRRINLWTRREIRWLRTLGRAGGPIVDKFNPGQKLNAIFIAGTIVVMFATGFVLEWFGFFPLGWRTGATFVHDVFALAVSVVIVGHVLFAVTHRDALRSMFKGSVTENWARTHASVWFREQSRPIAPNTGPEEGDRRRVGRRRARSRW
jgi:formate dehydrogenase subunit gamma